MGAISCSGFNSTKVIDAVFPANGGASTRLYTYNNIFSSGGPGWGARDAIVVRFTAPAAGDAYMSIAMTATGGMTTRTMNLSSNSCEFTKVAGSSAYYLESNSLSMAFSSGPSQYVRYVLNKGQTYYLNMANLDGGQLELSGLDLRRRDPDSESKSLTQASSVFNSPASWRGLFLYRGPRDRLSPRSAAHP